MESIHQNYDTAALLEDGNYQLKLAGELKDSDPSAAISHYKKARKYYKWLKRNEPASEENLVRISVCCMQIGDLYLQIFNKREAREWYLKSLVMDIDLVSIHYTPSVQMVAEIVERICATAYERAPVSTSDFKICGYGRFQSMKSELPYFEKIMAMVEHVSKNHALNLEELASVKELMGLIQVRKGPDMSIVYINL